MERQAPPKRAVFIERDGILTEPKYDRRQLVIPVTPAQLTINKEAIPVLRYLKESGLLIVVISNQPGISGGTIARSDMERMNAKLRLNFMDIDEISICPHEADAECSCRMPRASLITEAAIALRIEVGLCFVIGNKPEHAQAAPAAGCTSFMLKSPLLPDDIRCDRKLGNLHVIADEIVKHIKKQTARV